MLSADDPLPLRPRRIVVAGTSGSGKTTLAARIGELLTIPHVEIDALYHGAAWTPWEPLAADVDAFSAGPAWVTEWQYSAVRDLLAARVALLPGRCPALTIVRLTGHGDADRSLDGSLHAAVRDRAG